MEPLRGMTHGANASLRIVERFVSVQGEGLLVGTPSSFVRISGCNLRCRWCDTPQSSWRPEGTRVELDALVEFCRGGPRHVVVTGGEPLLFPEAVRLIDRLRSHGHHVTVETAATVDAPTLATDLVSMSPKLANSTPTGPLATRHEARRWRPEVIRALMRMPWQLKFVVRTGTAEDLAADLAEIEAALAPLGVADRDRDRVLLMPECTERERLAGAYAALIPVSTRTGFRVGQRLHIAVFGHVAGT